MTRTEIEKVIKEIIESENGIYTHNEDLPINMGLDSFGITVLFLELDERFGVYGEKDAFKHIDFSTLTINNILDKVEADGTY